MYKVTEYNNLLDEIHKYITVYYVYVSEFNINPERKHNKYEVVL